LRWLLAHSATKLLAARAGPGAGQGTLWRAAFQSDFGVSVKDFYAAVDAERV
jgi:hypothetical protein